MHTFNVAFSPRLRVWFAVPSDKIQGEFTSLDDADAKAGELNRIAQGEARGSDPAAIVPVTVDVSWQQIEDNLCAAWEGGSNYWLECHGCRPPTDPADAAKVEFRYQNALYPGGACLCRVDGERKTYELTRDKLLTGVQLFAAKYPKHFSDMVRDEGDADTGDVLLQCCLLGEVVYA
jgi:hypothetical protein